MHAPAASASVAVMVVDDEFLWRRGIEDVIEELPGLRLVPGRDNLADALDAIVAAPPDVLILDLVFAVDGHTEFGTALAWSLRWRYVPTRVVMMTADPNQGACSEALSAGVAGFVPKAQIRDSASLGAIIRRVCAGETVVAFDDPAVAHGITPAEVALLVALRDARSHELAAYLGVSTQTVNNRVGDIGRKLGASGRSDILARALELRVITVSPYR